MTGSERQQSQTIKSFLGPDVKIPFQLRTRF
jgi:hypothetical protein